VWYPSGIGFTGFGIVAPSTFRGLISTERHRPFYGRRGYLIEVQREQNGREAAHIALKSRQRLKQEL